MSKSNGRRPVNKTDGPKKLGKRAMAKSRRNDEGKAITESVLDMEATQSAVSETSELEDLRDVVLNIANYGPQAEALLCQGTLRKYGYWKDKE